MKKLFLGLLFLSLILFGTNSVKALNFEEGIKQSKAMALYLYADWADNAYEGKDAFYAMQDKYPKYNFVSLNIASNDAKAFNKIYHIYPNLPYVLLFRDGTRFSRFVGYDCLKSDSCFKSKLDAFAN